MDKDEEIASLRALVAAKTEECARIKALHVSMMAEADRRAESAEQRLLFYDVTVLPAKDAEIEQAAKALSLAREETREAESALLYILGNLGQGIAKKHYAAVHRARNRRALALPGHEKEPQ